MRITSRFLLSIQRGGIALGADVRPAARRYGPRLDRRGVTLEYRAP